MAEIIGLPKLSPTMEEGVLVRWVKKEGETIEPGDLVAEVETDKANMDFNVEDEGVLLKILVEEGAVVVLGAPVAIIGEAGEDISGLLQQVAQGGAQSSSSTSSTSIRSGSSADPQAVSPVAPLPKAEDTNTPLTSPSNTISPQGRILASPLAKTLAVENGIDLRLLRGSGPGGRIVERDVKATIAGENNAVTPTSNVTVATADTALTVAPTKASGNTSLAPAGLGEYTDEPHTPMRKRIAERLQQSKREIPHYRLVRTLRVDALIQFRKKLNELLDGKGKISINDMFIKACALALRDTPDCNASWQDDVLRKYTGVHIGIAVALPQGLVTPVLRHADLKGLGVISNEVKDLAARAKSRSLKMHEIQGSTFSVSNLGMFGIDQFDAIINPPEAGILAVGGFQTKPVKTSATDDPWQQVTEMTVTMSCDHRVIDGALGARFLQTLASRIENPESLAL